ncbi:MAG: cytochrome c biogenesis protein CcsA [Pyrinomonadaceae bacterium]|jgi:heme exporter protein C|nr:cytochrome c biogenesis protein CcsA [Pyrinomonadaceae bacterium]
MNWYKYASPPNFYPFAGKMIPWFAIPAAILFVLGLYQGLFVAPTDSQQGDAYRIIFIHVPAAWMGMLLYVLMAIYAAIGWAFNARLSSMMASAISITGAMFTFLSLVTGSLWGKPTWGTWWVWDARLTSTLILLFLYIGFISLQASIDDPRRADRAGAVLAIVGVINVPIIYFSVQWWNTLHQGATIRLMGKPTMAPPMLRAMLIMLAACWLYSIAVVLIRLRYIILEREQNAAWAAEAAGSPVGQPRWGT